MSEDIDKETYYWWLKNSRIIVPEHCTSSACCGPHWFTTEIEKDGNLYHLGWGWGYDRKNPMKEEYSIKLMFRMNGQEGEGI